jgi:hypothetical protein
MDTFKKWNQYAWPVRYYVNRSTYPHSVSPDGWVSNVRNGASTWGYGHTRCGVPSYRTPIQLWYGGDTTRVAGIGNDNACQGPDGYKVVSGGALAGSTLAAACVYWEEASANNTYLREADIKFDGGYAWFAYGGESCAGEYDIWALAAHEFGHFMGFGHVSEDQYPKFTMSPRFGTCHGLERRLARGERSSLDAKYGK